MTTEIKNAVMDVLKSRIDRENYGMLSNYRVCPRSLSLLHQKGIKITATLCCHDQVVMDGKTVAEITYRYAAKKRNGMYRMLRPQFMWLS